MKWRLKASKIVACRKTRGKENLEKKSINGGVSGHRWHVRIIENASGGIEAMAARRNAEKHLG